MFEYIPQWWTTNHGIIDTRTHWPFVYRVQRWRSDGRPFEYASHGSDQRSAVNGKMTRSRCRVRLHNCGVRQLSIARSSLRLWSWMTGHNLTDPPGFSSDPRLPPVGGAWIYTEGRRRHPVRGHLMELRRLARFGNHVCTLDGYGPTKQQIPSALESLPEFNYTLVAIRREAYTTIR